MRRKKSAGAGQPQPPQFATPIPNESIFIDALEAGESYTQQRWVDARFDAQEAEDVAFDQIIARNVRFGEANLRRLQALDCQFENADFANCSLEKAYLRRVEFAGSRLLGVKILDGDLEDVRFTRCSLNLGRLWTSSCKSLRFEHCSLQEASFDGTNLAGVVFYKCDLSQADFRNTKLKGADLRGSTIDGIKINAADLAGAIIDPAQAMQLIELFGVTVRSEDE